MPLDETAQDARLSSEARAQALIRYLNSIGAEAFQMRRGDKQRGAIFIQLDQHDGIRCFMARSDLDGHLAWHQLGDVGDKLSAQQHLDKKLRIDSDLWVIDIYDPKQLVDFGRPEYRDYL